MLLLERVAENAPRNRFAFRYIRAARFQEKGKFLFMDSPPLVYSQEVLFRELDEFGRAGRGVAAGAVRRPPIACAACAAAARLSTRSTETSRISKRSD